MPKLSTVMTLYDNVLQLNISKLNNDKFIIPGIIRSGTVTWSWSGGKQASINILVNMASASPYVELNYCYNDEHRKYKVWLVSVPSNLGSGEVWYFLCPHTGKRCRILYSVGGWFLHREAFNGVFYDSQIQSKRMRNYLSVVGPLFKTDKLYEELNKPYFKHNYNGQPTKRYARIQKQLEQSERVSIEDYEKVLAGIL